MLVGWVEACQSHGRRVMRNSPLCVRPVAHRASSLNGVRSSLRPSPTARQHAAAGMVVQQIRRVAAVVCGVLAQMQGCQRTCSLGLSCCSCSFLTSRANTASGGAVESMQDALMEITKLPPFFRKYWELRPTIRACGEEHGRWRARQAGVHQTTADWG